MGAGVGVGVAVGDGQGTAAIKLPIALGDIPTGTVATTVLLVASITETVPL